MLNSRIKIILILVLGIFLCGLVLFSCEYNNSIKCEAEQEQYRNAEDGELTSLIQQRSELEQRIDRCRYELDYGSVGPATILFAQPDDSLETSGIPEVKYLKTSAVIAVSDRYFPGNRGCLSVDQVKTCIEEGWEIALSCTSETDVSALEKRVEDAGLGEASCAYFPHPETDVYSSELKKLGIDRIWQYGKERDGFLAMGVADGAFETERQEVQKAGKCITAVIGFHESVEKTDDPDTWLSEFSVKADEGKFQIMSLSDAEPVVAENLENKKSDDKKLKTEIKECKAQLAEIDERIEAIEQ